MDSDRTKRLRELVERLTPLPLEPLVDLTAADAGPPITPKMCEIIVRLQSNLLLVEPTLNWIRAKEAELAGAQLRLLYSEEELTVMRERVE